MAQRISRKQIKQDEFLEAAADAGHWLENHWHRLAKWGGAALAIVVAVFGWWGYSSHRSERGLEILASGIATYTTAQQNGFALESDLERARSAFEEARALIGGAEGRRTASYYEGAALFRLKRFDEARKLLEGVGTRTPGQADTLGAMAQALLADLLESQGQGDQALAVLTAMLEQQNPAIPRDQVLFDAARIERKAGREAEARAHLQRIVDEFPKSPLASEARQVLTSLSTPA